MGNISKIRHLINKACLNSLLCLSYCNIVWRCTYRSHLHKIFLVQKTTVRIISSSNWKSFTSPLVKNLKLLNIYDINTLLSCKFVFNALYNTSWPSHVNNYFTFNHQIHHYPTREAPTSHLPLYKRNREQFSKRFNGPK